MGLVKWCLGSAFVGGSLGLAIIGSQVWGQLEAPPLTLPATQQAAPFPPPPVLDPPKSEKPSALEVIPAAAKGGAPLLPPPAALPIEAKLPPQIKFLPPNPQPDVPPPALGKIIQTSDKVTPIQPASSGATAPIPKLPSLRSAPANGPDARMSQDTAVHLEWIGPTATRPGRPITCQLVVSNTSSSTAHQVTVRLPLAPGVVCKSAEPAATQEGNQLVWSLGALPSTQARRVVMELVSATGGPLSLPAQATFTNSYVVHVREPKLVLKLRMADKVVAGENVTLNVTLSNPGDGATDFIKVRVQLPDGLQHPRGRTVDVDLGNLAPKESRTVQLLCVGKSGGVHKCVASATADDNLTASDVGQIEVLLPRLDLAVTGPKLRYIDRQALYTFKVTNPGTAPATNVTLQEVLPAGFKFHTASHGGRFEDSARSVSWSVGDLLPGQSKEVQLTAVAVAPGEQRHVASVTSGRGLKTYGEVVTRVEGLSALLIELADADDPVEVGAETAYEIRVLNTGTKAETNLEVVCTLPEQVEFKGAKCAAGVRHRVEGRDVIFEPLPRLAPRADAIYRVHVRGLTAADVRCRVRVRSDSITEPILREESTRIYNDEMPGR